MKLSNVIVFLLVAIAIVFFATVIAENTMPLPVYVALFVVLAGGILLFSFLNIVKQERYYAQDDMIIPAFNRINHIKLIGVVFVLSLFGALIFSSNKSVIPSSIITDFFSGFFQYPSPEIETAIVENPTILESFFSSISKIEQNTDWPIRTWLQYGFIFLAAAGLLLLIIVPRFYQKKASQKIPVINQGVFSSIIDWFRGILRSLSSIFKRKKRTVKSNKTDASEIARMAKRILASYSPEKKRTMQESVTLFAQLIIWGSKVRQVFWKPSHAPAEYCGLLTAVSPAWRFNRSIIRSGELFEQALYSSQTLSEEERKEFTNLVKEITAENI